MLRMALAILLIQHAGTEDQPLAELAKHRGLQYRLHPPSWLLIAPGVSGEPHRS